MDLGGEDFCAVAESRLTGVAGEEREYSGVAQETPRQVEVLEKERGAPPEEVIRDIAGCKMAAGAQHSPVAWGVALVHNRRWSMVRCTARGVMSAASTAAMRSEELHDLSGVGYVRVYWDSEACSATTSAALRGCRMRHPRWVASSLPANIGSQGTVWGSAA